jgi:hypothetical protein
MSAVVAAIEAAAPESAGRITYDELALPFPEEFESSGALPTPLDVGVRETVEHFRSRL